MEKYNKRAQIFLYFGFLLALAAVDCHWYAKRFPQESFLLGLPFIQAVYALWIAATAVCFVMSATLFWKARREQRAHQHRHRR